MVELIHQAYGKAEDYPETEKLTRCLVCKFWEVRYDDYSFGECKKIVPGSTITTEAQFYCAYGKSDIL